MTEPKEAITIATGIVTLVSGIVMCFLGFFLSADHDIAGSVLFYFGQCLIYTASVFGVVEYLRYYKNAHK